MGEDRGSPAWSEPPASDAGPGVLGAALVLDGPLPAADLQIVVSGTALEIVRLHDSLLSRAHQALDRLGGSLSAERALLGEEHRSLEAAWLQVHEARLAHEEERQ